MRPAGRELVAVVPVAAIEQLDLVDWLNPQPKALN